MTIASAFNDIAVAQGGTAAKSGAITAAIDALNDALAGSDQQQAKTIEQAVRLLGEHIGGGGSSIGDMTTMPFMTSDLPSVGSSLSTLGEPASINAIDIGGKPVIDWQTNNVILTKAPIGSTVSHIDITSDPLGDVYMLHTYNDGRDVKVESIEQVDMPITMTETEIEGETVYVFSWTAIENPNDTQSEHGSVLVLLS